MDAGKYELIVALRDLIAACTPSDAEPNSRGEMRCVRTPEWEVVEAARKALSACA